VQSKEEEEAEAAKHPLSAEECSQAVLSYVIFWVQSLVADGADQNRAKKLVGEYLESLSKSLMEENEKEETESD